MKYFQLLLFFFLIWPIQVRANDDVRCIQEYLSDTAFDPGPVDGQWGRKTAGAAERFFLQVGREVDGGLGKGNADAICRVFRGDQSGQLKAMGRYRVYPVEIDPDMISEFDQTFFDFEPYDLLVDQEFRCSFDLWRYEGSSDETYKRAEGVLQIADGRLKFGHNRWRTGGLADATYLQEQSNLAILETGEVVGKIPFFWKQIRSGEVAMAPNYGTLSKSFEAAARFPGGKTRFDLNGETNFEGVLELHSCVRAG